MMSKRREGRSEERKRKEKMETWTKYKGQFLLFVFSIKKYPGKIIIIAIV